MNLQLEFRTLVDGKVGLDDRNRKLRPVQTRSAERWSAVWRAKVGRSNEERTEQGRDLQGQGADSQSGKRLVLNPNQASGSATVQHRAGQTFSQEGATVPPLPGNYGPSMVNAPIKDAGIQADASLNKDRSSHTERHWGRRLGSTWAQRGYAVQQW